MLEEECERKIELEDSLLDQMRLFGYRPIETPTFEFFDIFSKEVGTTPSRDLYRFFDREGNTLALRPDVTPQVARAAASYYQEADFPLRLCYRARSFINHSSYLGRLKETTQAGAELIGAGGVRSDAEVLAMVCRCLTGAGLKEFQVSIGHADYLEALLDSAGAAEELRDEIRSLIHNRNFFGVEELLEGLALPEDLAFLFSHLRKLYRSPEELAELLPAAESVPRAKEALEYLRELGQALRLYGAEVHVSYELGQVSPYRYYTGIIFSAYTTQVGEEVCKGGRYDRLPRYFGREQPAIGFAFVVDTLLSAVLRQKIPAKGTPEGKLISYVPEAFPEAVVRAKRLRDAGVRVELLELAPGQGEETARQMALRHHLAPVVLSGKEDAEEN